MTTISLSSSFLFLILCGGKVFSLAFESPFKLPNFFPQLGGNGATNRIQQVEDDLLGAIANTEKRLDNSQVISDLVQQLEGSGDGISEAAIAPQVLGKWRLLHTSNAETASPIQRKAVDASKYNIYQDIVLRDEDGIDRLIVKQIVKFGDNFNLSVDALASTAKYPLEELTEREGTGEILGLNVLGVSKIGDEAKEDDGRPNSRISFVFDEGKFIFGDGKFTLPYPVPFRNPLFRDAVKGWIDVTYLSERVRISRGNKGTTFVLVKEE